jgi:hypothetical protein
MKLAPNNCGEGECEHVARSLARLLGACADRDWRAYQFALIHGRPESADVLEQRARRYEELAEHAYAHGWTPSVEAPPPHTAKERTQLNRLLAKMPGPTLQIVQRRRGDGKKGREYALAALEGEAKAVASAPEGLRNYTLNASAWTLARPELNGLLLVDEIERVLVAAGQDAGLSEREARACVRGALRRRGAGV